MAKNYTIYKIIYTWSGFRDVKWVIGLKDKNSLIKDMLSCEAITSIEYITYYRSGKTSDLIKIL